MEPSSERVQEALEVARRFTGTGGNAFRNEAGDLIVESRDGMRETRFDFYDPAPHRSPHMHAIEYRRVKNKKIPDPNRRIWPTDVSKR